MAEAANGQEAIEKFRSHRPDVTVMDLQMPGMNGIEAINAIRTEFPDARILMLSTHSGEEEIYRSLHSGARGYILKSAMREELLRAIRQVQGGKNYLDSTLAPLLAEHAAHRPLTGRELEVLKMVATGMGNKEIAAALAKIRAEGDRLPEAGLAMTGR